MCYRGIEVMYICAIWVYNLRIPKEQTKMDNPGKHIGYTTRRKTKQKHNTVYVGHHHTQAQITEI
jgi:hypothetical protein